MVITHGVVCYVETVYLYIMRINFKVVFVKKITWKIRIKVIELRAFRTFNRVFSQSKVNVEVLTLNKIFHEALINAWMT